MVRQHSVPEPYHIRYLELLARKKHQPSQRVVLWVESLVLKVLVKLRVDVHQQIVELSDFTVDATPLMVHSSQEAVS